MRNQHFYTNQNLFVCDMQNKIRDYKSRFYIKERWLEDDQKLQKE